MKWVCVAYKVTFINNIPYYLEGVLIEMDALVTIKYIATMRLSVNGILAILLEALSLPVQSVEEFGG